MRLGLSQQALANKAGVTQGLIGQIEAGINKGSKHTVAIARALGVTPDWLEGENSPPSEQQHWGDVSPQTREHQWLISAWDSASEEAREVVRLVMSNINVPLPAWADKDMRKDINNMLYAASHWLREEQHPKKIAA